MVGDGMDQKKGGNFTVLGIRRKVISYHDAALRKGRSR